MTERALAREVLHRALAQMGWGLGGGLAWRPAIVQHALRGPSWRLFRPRTAPETSKRPPRRLKIPFRRPKRRPRGPKTAQDRLVPVAPNRASSDRRHRPHPPLPSFYLLPWLLTDHTSCNILPPSCLIPPPPTSSNPLLLSPPPSSYLLLLAPYLFVAPPTSS